MSKKSIFNKIFQLIKNFTSRLFIYQIVIIWLIMKFSDIDKSTTDFQTRLLKTIKHFNMNNIFSKYISDDPSLLNMILLISETVCLIGALFGNKRLSHYIAYHFTLTTLIFFNPFLPENQFSIIDFDIRFDMLTAYGSLICFYLAAYYDYDIDENEGFDEETTDDSLVNMNMNEIDEEDKIQSGNGKGRRKVKSK